MKARSILLVSAALAACHVEQQASTADSTAMLLTQREQFGPAAYVAVAQTKGFEVAEEDVTATDLPVPRLDSIAGMVIRTATASIEVDSLEIAVAELRQLASRLGGYVPNTGIQVGRHRLRQGVITVKVPAPRFDELLANLRPIGTLEAVDVSAEDVGEEFVDVTARMDNARRLERRLIDLLASRTGKLKDVLDVEQALARVREQIERFEGRVRYLKAHAATSTLSVTVHEPVPVVGDAGKSVVAESLKQAWRNFVMLCAFVLQALGVVIPLAVVALAGWFIAKRSRRLWSQRAA